MYKKEFELAKGIAREVGLFLKDQSDKEVISSGGRDIKLSLDVEAERRIIDALQSKFNYSILSEEIGQIGAIGTQDPYWIIDPIDGTMNYSRGFPIACVSIALWMNNQPSLGVVYDFYRNELFSGLVGEGAWLNDSAISPSTITEKAQAILATGIPTYLNLDDDSFHSFVSMLKKYKKIRMIGSAALSLCYVACGRVDGYFEKNIKLWDVAAGLAINRALDVRDEILIGKNYLTTTSVGV